MNNEKYSRILLHGFSIGGYFWSECLVLMEKDKTKYQSVINRVVGQIWDSAADIRDIRNGFPKAVFPKSRKLQHALRSYMNYHLKTFDELASQHYFRASRAAYDNYITAPVLFFVSKTDLIGDEPSNRRIMEAYESRGCNVTWKCFDDSPHVGHFFKHREEYLRYLNDFLKLVGLEEDLQILKAKL